MRSFPIRRAGSTHVSGVSSPARCWSRLYCNRPAESPSSLPTHLRDDEPLPAKSSYLDPSGLRHGVVKPYGRSSPSFIYLSVLACVDATTSASRT